ncbi:hypothetical protein B0A55_06945 [Friedmanniomyces simplex]|uniref:Uncharacterized protein n=1 Tax=Friedmanniomyces simplex TaxID=329884 RepID=A0A4U0XAC4_9PEZI|nr:hypothetical protein B0A55_06945 [Friedmanniomyces simplex]
MLERLITERNLKDMPKNHSGAPLPLTVDRFDQILQYAVSGHPRSRATKKTKTTVFLKGSEAIDEAFLEGIEYQAPVLASVTIASRESLAPSGGAQKSETKQHAPKTPDTSSAKPAVDIAKDNDKDSDSEDVQAAAQKRRRLVLNASSTTAGVPQEGTPADMAQRKPAGTGNPSAEPSVVDLSLQTNSPVNNAGRLVAESIGESPKNVRVAAATAGQETPMIPREPSANIAPERDGGAPAPKRQKTSGENPDAANRMRTNEPRADTDRGKPANTSKYGPEVLKSVQPPQVSPLANSLVKISAKSIQDEITSLWTTIQNLTRNVLEDDPNRTAEWVLDPRPELLTMFRRLFRPNYQRRLLEIYTNGPMGRKEALEACLSIALFELVLDKPPPWDGPQDMLSKLEEDAELINKVLQSTGCKRTLEYVLWQVAKAKLDRQADHDEFRDEKLQHIAEGIATSILLVLDRQLHLLGAGGRLRVADVAPLVSDALILKGRLRAAPYYYELKWAVSGMSLQRDDMEEINGSQGRQEVLYGVTPRVRVKVTKESAWSMIARAKVFTRLWPKGKQ